MTWPQALTVPVTVPDLSLYEEALRDGLTLWLTPLRGGPARPLEVSRWCAPADAVDQELLGRCTGPTLDIGCGPGRLVTALAARGTPALGVDVTPMAVSLTQASGAAVLRRSVFDRLPGEGRWPTALLADGNIGIGGAPGTLLARARELLAPSGRLLAEVEPQDVCEQFAARLQDSRGRLSAPFRWARLGAPAVIGLADGLGYALVEQWASGGRRFVHLTRR